MQTHRIALALCAGWLAGAQAEVVPNPTFARGDSLPAGWSLRGEGEWRPVDGDPAIAVRGGGAKSAWWRSDPVAFEAGGLYRLRFRSRRLEGDVGGRAMAGPAFAYRDLGDPGSEWRRFSSSFAAPADANPDRWLRFGHWRLRGAVAFDDIELHRVRAVHRRVGEGLRLGRGERIEAGRYVFHSPQHTPLANISRPLQAHDAGFNTFRWVFGPGQRVAFRHQVGGFRQLAARIRVNVNHHTGGRLLVEVSTGDGWSTLGEVSQVTSASFDVPDSLLPAAVVRVRLRAAGEGNGAFQVDDYGYEARLDGPPPESAGSTLLVAEGGPAGSLRGRVEDPGLLRPGLADTLRLLVHNGSMAAQAGRFRAVVGSLGEEPPEGGWSPVDLQPGENRLAVPYRITGTGDRVLHLQVEADGLWRAEADLTLSVLHADEYGELLSAGGADPAVWWASSGWKVSRTRAPPARRGEALVIAAAGNETEAAQLVLRPDRPLRGLRLRPTGLTGPEGASLPADRVEVLRVGHVEVRRPTDMAGEAAPWPDPLLPVDSALDLAARRNQPFWIRVSVPSSTPGGTYEGALVLTAEGFEARVPLRVEVSGFDLPGRMTCETAFGFSPGHLWRYHGVDDEAGRRRLLDLYLESFSRHHISPYDPAPLDPPRITWPDLTDRVVAEGEVIEPAIDFTAWDAAMTRAIEEYGFNTFRLRLPGMGGGSFHRRREPALQGYGADTPQYQALFRGCAGAVERHLRRQGWLDEAFVYWFDEPAPKDYPFVMDGFRRLASAAPGLRRMLTEQVEPELAGGPDLWCPLASRFDAGAAAPRREAGERFWWYLCTVPKAPYPGLFIDRAGTDLRVWLWQTWQAGVDGILVWATNYWTSEAAYPGELQDPYEDPMSWMSLRVGAEGARRPWGNGDGRFLYPPPGALGESPVLAGPVESIRWEMLRDGIEDYEYLVMLRRALRSGPELTGEERRRFEALLEVPPEISVSMTRFTRDPAPIERRRREVAAALERLGGS